MRLHTYIIRSSDGKIAYHYKKLLDKDEKHTPREGYKELKKSEMEEFKQYSTSTGDYAENASAKETIRKTNRILTLKAMIAQVDGEDITHLQDELTKLGG